MNIFTDVTSIHFLWYSAAIVSYIIVLGLVVVKFKENLEKFGYVTGKDIFWFVVIFIFSPVVIVLLLTLILLAGLIYCCEFIAKLLNKPIFYKKTVDEDW